MGHGEGAADGRRFDALFADLGGQFSAADAAELAAEVADRVRRERGAQHLADRLRAAHGRRVRLQVRAVGPVVGVITESGPGWLLVAEEFGWVALVSLAAVLSISGLGAEARPPLAEHSLDARLDLRHALRRLVRDRADVVVSLTDGIALTGTLDRVGADFVDLARHETGEPRRRAAVRDVATIPLAAVAAVRSQAGAAG